MWTRAKLEQLAASEDAIFKDPRWDRVYLAVDRYEGTTRDLNSRPPVPQSPSPPAPGYALI